MHESVGVLVGRGTAHVVITESLSGGLDANNQSSGALSFEVDPDQDAGSSDSGSWFRGGGLGAETVNHTMLNDEEFAFNLSSRTRAYLQMDLQISDGGHLGAQVGSVQISTAGCVP